MGRILYVLVQVIIFGHFRDNFPSFLAVVYSQTRANSFVDMTAAAIHVEVGTAHSLIHLFCSDGSTGQKKQDSEGKQEFFHG